jgi:putative restriction endonuclease
MELNKPQDIFSLSVGDTVEKKNLYNLIQFSKKKSSSYWAGQEFAIGNTPQQGINWVGQLPKVKAVIIKTRPGAYDDDGWSNDTKTVYDYSFKARNSKINYKEKANQVLIKQPQHLYPIFLFTEVQEGWNFEGRFSVSEIKETYVILHKEETFTSDITITQDEEQYQEGGLRYVTHLMVERSQDVVNVLKNTKLWLCEICNTDFNKRYGVHYIEAHYKIQILTYSDNYLIKKKDLALLCPNCHKAVHIFMKKNKLEYNEIKSILVKSG